MVKSKAQTKPIDVKVKAYFLSDVHLESEKDSNFFSFNRLLQTITRDEECTHLFLLGDIFDLWVAHHKYFTEKFTHTLKILNAIKERGVEVHYFEGNHDLDLKPYFAAQGFHVHEEAFHCQLGSLLFRIEHGDQMDPEDRSYLFLRWILRTPVMRFVGRRLPGYMVQYIGNSMSSTSRRYTNHLKAKLGRDRDAQRDRIWRKIRRHVLKELDSGLHFDVFVSGHVHEEFHEKLAVNGKDVEVINLGSWLTERKPFGLYQEGSGFEIRCLND